MNALRIATSVLTGALAMQAALSQTGASMAVTTTIGTVGYVCEPFSCDPHQTLAGLGEAVRVDLFGRASSPYVLFSGWPVAGCQPFPQLGGALALWTPVTLEIGAFGDSSVGPACSAVLATTGIVVPTNTPLGTQFRLQAIMIAPMDGRVTFTRAVEIHTR